MNSSHVTPYACTRASDSSKSYFLGSKFPFASILSQVLLPEYVLFDRLARIMPMAQKKFLRTVKTYWPILYSEGFRGQWQLVNFGTAEQADWQDAPGRMDEKGNLLPRKYDFEESEALVQAYGVTWDEFMRGLRRIRDIRNTISHPRKMENEGTVRQYDMWLQGAHYFFVTIKSGEGAKKVQEYRCEIFV